MTTATNDIQREPSQMFYFFLLWQMKCRKTEVETKEGEILVMTRKWQSLMDEAIEVKPSIRPHPLRKWHWSQHTPLTPGDGDWDRRLRQETAFVASAGDGWLADSTPSQHAPNRGHHGTHLEQPKLTFQKIVSRRHREETFLLVGLPTRWVPNQRSHWHPR